MAYDTPYAVEILGLKEDLPNGDIISMKLWKVPKNPSTPEGYSYTLAYIREGKRILGYDNENHGTGKSNHHKHIGDRILPFTFVDPWTLIETFVTETNHLRPK